MRMIAGVFVTIAMTAAGCGGTTTEPLPELTLSLAGHYDGAWNLSTADTVQTCFIGCGYEPVEFYDCHGSVDLTQQGGGLVGTFVIDSTESLPCKAISTSWVRLAGTGEITGGRIDSLAGSPGMVVGQGRLTVGQGGPGELERLTGCTAQENFSAWTMLATAGDAAAFGESPARGTVLGIYAYGSKSRPSEFRMSCRGRVLDLRISFLGNRET